MKTWGLCLSALNIKQQGDKEELRGNCVSLHVLHSQQAACPAGGHLSWGLCYSQEWRAKQPGPMQSIPIYVDSLLHPSKPTSSPVDVAGTPCLRSYKE